MDQNVLNWLLEEENPEVRLRTLKDYQKLSEDNEIGWTRQENDPVRRFALIQKCFDLQLQGYRTETDIPGEMLNKLPLFIDMVLIENIVDEFECCRRECEELDYEDIEDAAQCLIESISYAGFGQN